MQEFKEIHKNLIQRLKDGLPAHLKYHDVAHTEDVIEKAEFLANLQNLSISEIKLIKIAALYHDSGFLIIRENHEDKSCEIAEKDLISLNFAQQKIRKICSMIQATKIPQNAISHCEKIIADADLFYLGTNQYSFYAQKLYEEIKHFSPEITAEDWYQIQVNFMEQHRFFTEYGQTVLKPIKEINLRYLKNSTQSFD